MDGVCAIKSEYLAKEPTDHDNPLKRHIQDTPEDGASNAKQQNLSRKERKKAKRGQNKSRKHPFKISKEDNLCKTLFNGKSENKCTYEKCKFIHNMEKYLETKPKDISGTCFIYTTKGFCHRGITCRFGRSHVDDNFNNMKNELFNVNAPLDTLNQIKYDLQVILRKRAYNFDLSKKVLADVDKLRKDPQNCKKTDTVENVNHKHIGYCSDSDTIKERTCERKRINFREKLFLSPLTTVGNLPFRRICKEFGADVTCGEMACSVPIINGISQEWALVKRHISEDIFGIQLCGNNPQLVTFASQVLMENCDVDFIDLNLGCPIELIYGQGAGSALLRRHNILEAMVRSCSTLLGDKPFTVKTRTGVYANKNVAHEFVPKFEEWGASAVTIHGRSREQRYTKNADWLYIEECASKADNIPVIGNGDVLSFEDYNKAREIAPSISGIMVGRGALIKPWLFKEIKEQTCWDPSSSERFEIMKKYINYGLEHWGSDTKGVESTRRFFLEWQSFMYRYVPYGILEKPPQKINKRPDPYIGRDDLETLMASPKCSDWIKLSEMFLGQVPDEFNFLPKHKANSF